MFVLGLVLVNVALIALRLFDGAGEEAGADAAAVQQEIPLSAIELPGDIPPDDVNPDPESLDTPPGDAGEEPETPEDSIAEAAGEPDGHACVRIGPFDSESEQASLESELQELFSRVHARETKSIVDDGYWVFLPSLPSRSEAELAVEKLKAAGVSDYYLVREGESLNAVSLGIYDRREPAEARRRQVRGLVPGLDIVIELKTRIQSKYWLDAGPVDALNPALIQLSLSHPAAEQRQIACPSELTETER
jgi:hypothetical protein